MTDQTKSPFTLGVKLAKITHSSFGGHSVQGGIAVSKVTPTGLFEITYEHGHTPAKKFKPKWVHYANGGNGVWHADEVGSKFSREHYEVWSAEHDAFLENKERTVYARQLAEEVSKRVGCLNLKTPEDRVILADLCKVLDIPFER